MLTSVYSLCACNLLIISGVYDVYIVNVTAIHETLDIRAKEKRTTIGLCASLIKQPVRLLYRLPE